MKRPGATAAVIALSSIVSTIGLRAADLGYDPLPMDPQFGYTMFSIPQTETPPVADGEIKPGEWDHAFVINAMADQQQRPPWVALYQRWAVWRLMWDVDNLYVCAESQRLPGEDLVAKFRDETLGGNTVMDDSYEIHFTPVGRNAVGTKLPWSCQAILNPLGVGFYTKFTWSVAARTTGWRPDWQVGNRILDDRWAMELVVPRQSLAVTEANQPGQPWSFLFARNWKRTGWNQSALPGHYTSFAVPQEQAFGYLSDDLYAQLPGIENLLAGDIDIALRLGSVGADGGKVAVRVLVEEQIGGNAEGEPFRWEKSDEVAVAAGAIVDWRAQEDAKLTEGKTYRLFIDATPVGADIPLLKLNCTVTPGRNAKVDDYAAKFVSVPYKFTAQLAPMANKLSVFADFLYAPDAEAVVALKVTVSPEGSDEPLFTGSSRNVHHKSIRDVFDLPVLSHGTYAWTMTLTDEGGKVVAEKTDSFTKSDEAAEFPWFTFDAAKTDRVLWPYAPIEVENGGARIGYWGGDVYLNGLCLPRQVAVTANREWRPALLEERPSVLAGETRISAVQAGKPAKVQLQGFPRTTAVAKHRVAMRGYGVIGKDVEIQSDATFHQDGLLWVALTLRPARDSSSGRDTRRKEATLDSLTIDIPLEPHVAEYIVAHGQPGYASHTIDRLPAGEGVVWDCTEIGRSILTYGNFVPVVWLGDEQRGLTFLAENNVGWVHAGTPDQQVVRENGAVVLRLNVVQAPLTIKGDHTVRFGFLPSPMRKMTPGWRMLNTGFEQSFRESFGTGRNAARGGGYNSSYIPASYDKSRLLMFGQTTRLPTALAASNLPRTPSVAATKAGPTTGRPATTSAPSGPRTRGRRSFRITCCGTCRRGWTPAG